MAIHVALVRAIGPVTHAKMRMAALKAVCEAAGLDEVVTVGNTGNLLIRSGHSPAAVRRLVQGAVESFGLDNEVFHDSPGKMAAVVAADPFPETAATRPSELGVCTFRRVPDWTPLAGWDGPERCAMIGAHLVVDYPVGITGSRLRIEKLLGATMTQRNWTVFAGLAAKAAAMAQG